VISDPRPVDRGWVEGRVGGWMGVWLTGMGGLMLGRVVSVSPSPLSESDLPPVSHSPT